MQNTRRTTLSLPEDVHKALRLYAAEKDIDLQVVVADALRRYLGMKKEDN